MAGKRVRWRPWAPATARIVAFIEAREGWWHRRRGARSLTAFFNHGALWSEQQVQSELAFTPMWATQVAVMDPDVERLGSLGRFHDILE